MHPETVLAVNLQAVHAEIDHGTVDALGVDLPHRDEGAAVLFPGGENRKIVEVDVVALVFDLLARTLAVQTLGEDALETEEVAQHPELLGERGGRFHVHQLRDLVGDALDAAAEEQFRPTVGAEDVHQYRCLEGSSVSAVDGPCKEQRLAAFLFLHFRIGEMGDLEVDIKRFVDNREFLVTFQQFDGALHGAPLVTAPSGAVFGLYLGVTAASGPPSSQHVQAALSPPGRSSLRPSPGRRLRRRRV